MPAAERVRLAARRRGESDYIFSYWPALGWTILTLGIYGLYVFYQLVRRMRDHNARRLELLDAATTVAWEQAGRSADQPDRSRPAGLLFLRSAGVAASRLASQGVAAGPAALRSGGRAGSVCSPA